MIHRFAWQAAILTLAVLYCPASLIAQIGSGCVIPKELEGSLSVHPSAGAYDTLGQYFAQRSMPSCSISAFQASIRRSPDVWDVHYHLAAELVSSGDAQRGYEEMQIALHLNPGSLQVHLGSGLALTRLDRLDEAIDEFRAVVRDIPDSIPALDALATTLISEKRYTAAIHSLQNAPSDSMLQLDLAKALVGKGDPKRAAEILESLLRSKPADAAVHTTLGLVYADQGQYREAALQFEESFQLEPANDVVQAAYIKALINAGQYAIALPVCQRHLRSMPHDFEALEQTGEVESRVGDYTAAEMLLQQAVAINPDHYNARYFLGVALAALGRAAEARVHFEKALELTPESTEARYRLARVLSSLGIEDKATEELKLLQRMKDEAYNKNLAVTKSTEATKYLQAGETRKAITLYQESIAEDASNSRAYYDLSLALQRQGALSDERRALTQSIQLDTRFAPAHNQIGFLDMESGNYGEAENEFKTAIVLDPQYAEAQNNLGVLYARLGKSDQAEHLLRESTENDPLNANAFVNLGVILASESRFREAEQALRQGTRLSPTHAIGLSALATVLKHLDENASAAWPRM